MSAEQTDLLRDELSGKIVIVTGGGSGIGAALARAFGGMGAKVGLHYHQSDPGGIAALVDEISAAGGETHTLPADFSSTEVVAETIKAFDRHFGGIDILINNAGSMVARRLLAELDDAFVDLVFSLNARSVVTASQAALPVFKRRGSGCIINVSSISARTGGSPGSSIYSAAKGFVSTFTRSMAKELAEYHIRVNAISPGTIDTAFHERFSSQEKLKKTRAGIPLQRLGRAGDCVGTALYLASERLSGYVTGQVIEINGGQLMA